MKCDYTLSDLNLPCTKWLPCGEPAKIMEYTEIRILTIVIIYVHKCIVDNLMLASILITNCVDIVPVAIAKSILNF